MEYWDLYDKDRNKLHKKVASDYKLRDDEFMLVAHLCIFNNKNQLLIQKRSENKKLYPSLWDLTISGHVLANENSRQAMERECLEEIGYKVNLQSNRAFATFNFKEGFDDFFMVSKNLNIKDLSLEKAEVDDIMWASKKEVLELLKSNYFLPYHKSFIELIFFAKDELKIHTK